ncbi:MAG: hypothetical protein M1818_003120 [Claussenomyces sp. TS43310]|nr:MAG: hypothetical protein M1818_003120 [Claussenomyces sp. TS43310]
MSGPHISNDAFFLRLSELFEQRRRKEHGSIFLTQKRMSHGESIASLPEATSTFPDLDPSKPLPLIVRATDGKSKEKREERVKLSTVVEADALERFFARYSELCKSSMSGLKKRDRSKRKEKLKAKKKKGGVIVEEVKKI